VAKVESEARLDGRNMVMVLAPDKRAKQAAASKAKEEGHGDATDGAPEAPPAPATTIDQQSEAPPAPQRPAPPKKDDDMPKMKTDKGAQKRIKVTGTGRLRRRKAFRSHLLEHKSATRKRGSDARRTSRRPKRRPCEGCSASETRRRPPSLRAKARAASAARPPHHDERKPVTWPV